MNIKQSIVNTCGECGQSTRNHSLICDNCAPLYDDKTLFGKCPNCSEVELTGTECSQCGYGQPDESYKRMGQSWGLPS